MTSASQGITRRWPKWLKPGWLRKPAFFPGGLQLTQFVSSVFFGAGFATAFWRADGGRYRPAVDGFGPIGGDLFRQITPSYLQTVFAFCIMAIFVIGNAGRYYLSFWIVEESPVFRELRPKMETGYRKLEWCLRFASLGMLYLVEASFANKGHNSEILMTFVFGALLVWDQIVLRSVKSRTLDIAGDRVDDFVKRVRLWRKLEAAGFIITLAYAILVHWPGGLGGVQPLELLVGLLTGGYLVLLGFDIGKNWDYYSQWIAPMILGMFGAWWLTLYFAYGILLFPKWLLSSMFGAWWLTLHFAHGMLALPQWLMSLF